MPPLPTSLIFVVAPLRLDRGNRMARSVNHSDESSASVPVEASDNEQSSSQQAPTQVRPSARERFGGMHWGAAFLGFAVTTFFTILFFGIVGAVVGAVGYQMGAKVPKIGSAVSGTTQQLGVGTVAGTLIALFLAYFNWRVHCGPARTFRRCKERRRSRHMDHHRGHHSWNRGSYLRQQVQRCRSTESQDRHRHSYHRRSRVADCDLTRDADLLDARWADGGALSQAHRSGCSRGSIGT